MQGLEPGYHQTRNLLLLLLLQLLFHQNPGAGEASLGQEPAPYPTQDILGIP